MKRPFETFSMGGSFPGVLDRGAEINKNEARFGVAGVYRQERSKTIFQQRSSK
jgi:hypothetical protein